MESTEIMAVIAKAWVDGEFLPGTVSTVACPTCERSDLALEATDEQHARIHGLIAALEEVVSSAVEEYLQCADCPTDRELRLENVDGYCAELRRQARLIASEALAAASAAESRPLAA